jgi:hypothetical protein
MTAPTQPGPGEVAGTVTLWRRIHGLVQTQLLFVAARLGIADLLADGGRPVEELARLTGTIESRLYRILRALASMGVFAESKARWFEMTPMAQLLRSDHPESLRNLAIMMGSNWHVRGWANILDGVRSEESPLGRTLGEDMFDFFGRNPLEASVFDEAMACVSTRQADAICRAYDFPQSGTVVDVGGGSGLLLFAILAANPGLSGILFDRSAVVAAARAFIQARGLNARCRAVEGDFFASVPPGGDVYVLKYIVHDWGDSEASRILGNCRRALNRDGRVAVIDTVVAERAPTFEQTSLDIEMMVIRASGLERTEAQFSALFRAAGLRLTRVIPTRSGLSVVEGIPAA